MEADVNRDAIDFCSLSAGSLGARLRVLHTRCLPFPLVVDRVVAIAQALGRRRNCIVRSQSMCWHAGVVQWRLNRLEEIGQTAEPGGCRVSRKSCGCRSLLSCAHPAKR